MAIIDVGLLSGFKPITKTLKNVGVCVWGSVGYVGIGCVCHVCEREITEDRRARMNNDVSSSH